MSKTIIETYKKLGLEKKQEREKFLEMTRLHERYFPRKKKIFIDLSSNTKRR